jgi:hypothetical protein
MPRENWPHLHASDRDAGPQRRCRLEPREAAALETVQTVSGTTRDALFAHAMTGSAVGCLAIVTASHLEMLLRCVFHGRG